MQIFFDVEGTRYKSDLSHAIDISIPLDFQGEQPTAFGLPRAEARAAEVGKFVGDVRRGGSVNCEVATLCPHASGTHTECVGHLTQQRIAVRDTISAGLLRATLVTASTVTVPVTRFHEDAQVQRGEIASLLAAAQPGFLDALVIRTLPNPREKRFQSYSGTNPPYLTADAVQAIREAGVRHLLVDLPSLDREKDDGALAAHRAFFGLAAGDRAVSEIPRRTITELIYADNATTDGSYLLSLQVAPFVLDAAPSRPLLYAVQPCS